jgi:hypothetical protein
MGTTIMIGGLLVILIDLVRWQMSKLQQNAECLYEELPTKSRKPKSFLL